MLWTLKVNSKFLQQALNYLLAYMYLIQSIYVKYNTYLTYYIQTWIHPRIILYPDCDENHYGEDCGYVCTCIHGTCDTVAGM